MSHHLPSLEAHPHARAVLGAALPPAGEPSHAYLFCGPAGAGKAAAARSFAAALLADGAGEPDSARERAIRGVHPDLTWVVPSGAHVLLSGDIAEPVVAAASRTPFEAGRRVFVIERADTMNDEAANRLLKTLEEPPAHAHLLLLTERPAEVLPTVASRCQGVRFEPPTATMIAARLREKGVDPPEAAACAGLAGGDFDRAQRLAGAPGRALRGAAEDLARALLAGQASKRPWSPLLEESRRAGEPLVAELQDSHERALAVTARRDRRRLETEHAERLRRTRRRAQTAALDLGLALIGLWYRDLVCLTWGAGELIAHGDRVQALEQDAAGRDPVALRQAVELVEETRRRLVVNVTEELACEALSYRIEALVALAPAP